MKMQTFNELKHNRSAYAMYLREVVNTGFECGNPQIAYESERELTRKINLALGIE